MDIPTDWLTSQLFLGLVLAVLLVVGVLFFFRVAARPAPPSGAEEAHDHGAHDGGPGADEDAEGRSGPGAYGPIAPAASTSVFETEPCWVSLLPGRSAASAGAPAAAGRGAVDDAGAAASGAGGGAGTTGDAASSARQ